MRIAMFAATLPEPGRKCGGVDFAAHRLANQLAAGGGDEVTVYSLTGRPDDAAYEHVLLFPGWRRHLTTRPARQFLLPALLNTVDFRRHDVLHLHGDDWFLLRRPIATVRTLHGSALREAQSATSLRRKLLQYGFYPLEHVSARVATVPVAVGSDTARIYGVGQRVRNGVDPERFRPGLKAPQPTVLFVGTWLGRKRGRFLFEQFVRRVRPAVPGARLYMVSDTCPGAEGVTVVARPDDVALAALYRRAWVFAYPSVYEGFGMPYVEAMASGTAVLSSPNPGARDVLEGGACGAIVDDAHFADRLIHLLRDEAARRTLEQAGLERAAGYSWASVAAEHRAVYLRAVASHHTAKMSRTAAPGPSRERPGAGLTAAATNAG